MDFEVLYAALNELVLYLNKMKTCLEDEQACFSKTLDSNELLALEAKKKTILQFIKKIELNLTSLLEADVQHPLRSLLDKAVAACPEPALSEALAHVVAQYVRLANECKALNTTNGVFINKQIPRIQSLKTLLGQATDATVVTYDRAGVKTVSQPGHYGDTEI